MYSTLISLKDYLHTHLAISPDNTRAPTCEELKLRMHSLASHTSFRWLDLPLEVQILIFDQWHLAQAPGASENKSFELSLALLMLDRATYNTFAPAWYREKLFRVNFGINDLKALLDSASDLCLHNLRRLELVCDHEEYCLQFFEAHGPCDFEEAIIRADLANFVQMAQTRLPAVKRIDLKFDYDYPQGQCWAMKLCNSAQRGEGTKWTGALE